MQSDGVRVARGAGRSNGKAGVLAFWGLGGACVTFHSLPKIPASNVLQNAQTDNFQQLLSIVFSPQPLLKCGERVVLGLNIQQKLNKKIIPQVYMCNYTGLVS